MHLKDAQTIHEHVAVELIHAILGANLHLWPNIEAVYGCAGSPNWPVNVSEPGTIGDRHFDVGWAKKEPDAAVWNRKVFGDSVVEVAFNNETRAQLLWECRLWSQQGLHPTPVKSQRNIPSIKIENAMRYRQDPTTPAMAILMLWAADDGGVGPHQITLFNATPSYQEV
ncbi:unnamed protein product [Sympodiomycopsis kandeliae]